MYVCKVHQDYRILITRCTIHHHHNSASNVTALERHFDDLIDKTIFSALQHTADNRGYRSESRLNNYSY